MAFVTASDGMQIAYETVGDGPPLVLLHGGGMSRQSWFEHGYVEPLAALGRRLILIDARAHGDSGKSEDRAAFAVERVMADVLAVADACDAPAFDLVGYSYGGNIGRFLASRTDRVTRFVLIGIGFGGGAEGPFRARVDAMLAPFAAVLADPPDPDALSPEVRAQWDRAETRRMLAWFSALRDWPGVEPHELRCPTLWLVGSKNEVGALDNLYAHQPRLAEYGIEAQILPDLDHAAEMSARETVLPHLLQFLM